VAENRAHVFQWSNGGPPDWPTVAAVALCMAGSILLAQRHGQLPAGLAVAFGALLAGNARSGGALGEQARERGAVLLTALAAAGFAALCAGRGWWGDMAMVAAAGLAALAGGYSRGLAMASGRFIVFSILAGSFAGAAEPAALFLLTGAGTLITLVVALLFAALWRKAAGASPPTPMPTPATATARQRFRRWRRSLRGLAGWQFALRLVPALAVAAVADHLWPGHHLHWIAVTIAILCRREPERPPVMAVQRSLGALLGVAATGLMVGWEPHGWALAAPVAALSGLATWLRPRSYLAYAACMTPLIILLLDAGRPVEASVLVDRLAATVAGAALVVAANAIVARLPAANG